MAECILEVKNKGKENRHSTELILMKTNIITNFASRGTTEHRQ